jgi:hypothetical protein
MRRVKTRALEVLQVSPVLSVAKASLPDIVHEVGIATKLARTRIEDGVAINKPVPDMREASPRAWSPPLAPYPPRRSLTGASH